MSAAAARWAVVAWLAFAAACLVVAARTPLTTDMSAFLPRSPTPAQQVLVDELRDGVVSRLMLIAIEGGPPEALARASRRLAAALRGEAGFAAVSNGDDANAERDREFLWRNRYLLSPGGAERYAAAGLRARFEESLDALATPAGMLLRRTLPADPTGELMRLLEPLEGRQRPPTREGVWFSADGGRALLVAQTRAAAFDIDAQERALDAVRGAFAAEAAQATGLRLAVTGPGVFSVASRAAIRYDAVRFALIAAALIAALALAFYRSPRVLGLGFLPVLTGAAAGVAAVGLGFGEVHGITIAFGITLLGEGVDYAIYLFAQSTPGTPPYRTLDRIWPTLRLGVLTSLCGFSAMLFSGFTGLAQLGLFSIAGLAVAAAVTRWVLPALMPAGFTATAVGSMAPAASRALGAAPALRYPMLAAVVLAVVFLAVQRGAIWSDDLAALSPVPRAEQELDGSLRRALGAPDVRYLVIARGTDEEAALEAAEAVAPALQSAVERGLLAGYDSPAHYRPSRRAQHARQAAIPAPDALRASLQQALRGLPYRAQAFDPFLRDAAAARRMPPVDRGSLDGTSFALQVDGLLARRGAGWTATLPLRGVTDAAALARELEAQAAGRALFLDIRGESRRLYVDYRREALGHAAAGAVAIVALLWLGLRSARRVLDVLAPLVAAVVVATAVLALSGPLSIFHLVGLLLVAAVGSNYSLFFDRQRAADPHRGRTLVSLLFACASTLIGFGVLSLSELPVLRAIGSTVALGAALALVFSAILSRHEPAAPERHP